MSMLLRMVTGGRIHKDGYLFRRERAYLVDEDFGMDLLGMDNNDLPIFGQTTKDKAKNLGLSIIDLTSGVSEGEGEGKEEPVKEKEPKNKTVVKKAAKKKLGGRGKPTIKRAKVKPPVDDKDVEQI